MAAYPFSQSPLFLDFKKRLVDEYECEHKTMEFRLGGDFRTIPYFERQVGDRRLRATVFFNDEDRVEFSDLRRICRALEVPPEAFGLELEGWYDPDPE